MESKLVLKFKKKKVKEEEKLGELNRDLRKEEEIEIKREEGLIKILGDEGWEKEGKVVLRKKKGKGEGRVKRKKIIEKRKRNLIDKLWLKEILEENKKKIERKRRNGMMEKSKNDRRDNIDKKIEMVVRRWIGGWSLKI